MIKLKDLLKESEQKVSESIDEIKDEITGTCVKDGTDGGMVDDETDNVFTEPNTEDELVETGKAFKKLKGKLSHQKGIYDPAGLAASIGRKSSMGKKAFQKKAAAGKKSK